MQRFRAILVPKTIFFPGGTGLEFPNGFLEGTWTHLNRFAGRRIHKVIVLSADKGFWFGFEAKWETK